MKTLFEKSSFTLLEILIVTIIIALLVSFSITQYIGAIERARKSEAIAVMDQIRKAEIIYHAQYGVFTNSFSRLAAVTGIEVNSQSRHFNYAVVNPLNPLTAQIRATSKIGSKNYGMHIKTGGVFEF